MSKGSANKSVHNKPLVSVQGGRDNTAEHILKLLFRLTWCLVHGAVSPRHLAQNMPGRTQKSTDKQWKQLKAHIEMSMLFKTDEERKRG